MYKKKCPACGSTDTIKILYGMPTYEAFEAAERGEICLGGCCIFTLVDMISFEFFVGGYFGTSHFIYIDGKKKIN